MLEQTPSDIRRVILTQALSDIADLRQPDLIGQVQWAGARWTMATEGHLLVLVAGDVTSREGNGDWRNVNLKSVFGKDWRDVAGVAGASTTVSLDALRHWAGTFEIASCDICSGTGRHECACGHEHECGNCDGSGDVGPAMREGQLGPSIINRVRLALLLRTAPVEGNCQVQWSREDYGNESVKFEAPGWIAVLCCLFNWPGEKTGPQFFWQGLL